MMRHFWILLIEILVLAFDAFKGNAIDAEDFLLPPSFVSLTPIGTAWLRLHWGSPNITNETLTGFNITWDGSGTTFVGSSYTEFKITNLPTPGRKYTARISAYYATQQNSEYINATSYTFPSPVWTMAIVSRTTDRFDLNWTNEGVSDHCFVWVDGEANAVISCFAGNRTAVITNLSTPGKQYTVHFVIQSGPLNSSMSYTIITTIPSPASSITVSLRQTNRFVLTWTNEGVSDHCFAWVDEEVSAITFCSAENKTAVITGLTPGKEYTINIVIQSGQLNSTGSDVTERTFPSPASSITVSLRQTNRFVLNWTNEGVADRCFVWVQEATLATTSCFTGSKTAVIADLPTPGKRYTIYLMTQSGQLASATSNITETAGPFELHLNANPRSSNSTLITWTLSNVTGTVPEAIYNLTITDTRYPTIVIHEYVAGFYNRSVVVSGLDAYWNYSVSIVAFILDENKEELASDGMKIDYFQTLPSTPGRLQLFAVKSLKDEQRCDVCELTWEAPIERDLNGIITNYVIRWQQVGGTDRGSTEVPGDWRKRTVRVLPEDQQYYFTIQAKTQAGEGVATIKTLLSTGSCVPAQVQNVSSILVTTGSDNNNDLSTENSFVVTYDLSFFLDNKNGNVTNSGLLVREVPDQKNITGAPENGNECLYSSALTWSEAITRRRIPEYLATGENWLADSKNVTRKKRSILQQFVVGSDDSCSKDVDVNCNGPLPPDRKYQVRAMSCTRSGCHKTEYSSDIKMTKKSSSSSRDWIAAAVLVPIIVCIVAGVLIYIFIIKPRRKNGLNVFLPMR